MRIMLMINSDMIARSENYDDILLLLLRLKLLLLSTM